MRLLHVLLSALLLTVAAIVARAQHCTGNEAWVPVGEGLSSPALASAELNGLLYVVQLGPSNGADPIYTLSAWDGKEWTRVSTFRMYTINNMELGYFKLIPYNGDLYITGPITNINEIPGTTNIARWNGTSWNSVGGGVSGSIEAVAVYNGELYVGGDIDAAGTIGVDAIARYNGTLWRRVGEIAAGGVLDLAVYNGRLFAVGGLLTTKSDTIYQVAVWDGLSWTPEALNLRYNSAGRLTVYRDKLYIVGILIMGDRTAKMAEYEGSRWKVIDVPRDVPSLAIDAVGLDQLYLYRTSYGDLSPSEIWTWDGSMWTHISEFADTTPLYRILQYKEKIYAVGTITESCDIKLNYFARLCRSQECGLLSGVDHENPGEAATSVFIYPNPTGEKVRIAVDMNRGAMIMLVTSLGVEAGRWESDGSGTTTLDVSTLPAGVYMLRAETRHGVVVDRLSILR